MFSGHFFTFLNTSTFPLVTKRFAHDKQDSQSCNPYISLIAPFPSIPPTQAYFVVLPGFPSCLFPRLVSVTR